MKYVLPAGLPAKPGRYFTWAEMFTTRQAVTLIPTFEHCQALIALCAHVLDPLREHFGSPVFISSGFRSPELNARIGGSATSAHLHGCAADLKVGARDVPKIASEDAARWLASLPVVDQAIWYHPARGGHVHVGMARPGTSPRRELRYQPQAGATVLHGRPS
jgi:hypothetical protein